jgi:hypothetical protein
MTTDKVPDQDNPINYSDWESSENNPANYSDWTPDENPMSYLFKRDERDNRMKRNRPKWFRPMKS